MNKNRLVKYLRELDIPPVKCVIVSETSGEKVSISLNKQVLSWEWSKNNDGLVCPGLLNFVVVSPYAAEALVTYEIEELLVMEGILANEVIFVNEYGENTHDIFFHPKVMGNVSYDSELTKKVITELYREYKQQGNRLSESLIGGAISVGALGHFLSLVNI